MKIKRSTVVFCVLILALLLTCVLVSCVDDKDDTKVTGSEGGDVTSPADSTGTGTDAGDDTPDSSDGETVRISYRSADEVMGTIEGSEDQNVTIGKKSSVVTAVAEVGYEFVSWSDGSTEPTRSDKAGDKGATYTATFRIKPLELPILMIETEGGEEITSKDYYLDGKISVLNTDEKYLIDGLDMKIRGRGNYTWSSTFNRDPMYNKRPYRLKLSEGKKLCGTGEGKSKNWVLFADHCDQSLLRNNIVYSFAKSLSGIVWQPAVQSVEVYLNGEYIGVYLLVEHVKVDENKIALSEDLSQREVGFLAMYSNYASQFYVGGHSYEVKSDLSEDPNLYNEQMEYIQECISECWEAIRKGNQQKVEELIDIDSVIDTYIVHELFKNLDTGHDNFYMFKDKGDDKLHIGPVWDFDQCAGNANEDVDNPENIRGGEKQPWYSYLLRCGWFKKKLVARWNELKPKVDLIPDMITAKAEAGYNSYCRNFDKWQIFGYCINRETYVRRFTTYKEHYEYFAKFMVERTEWFDGYLNDPAFVEDAGGEFSLKGNGTFESPYLVTSAADFSSFTNAMKNGSRFDGEYFLQTADIDMTSVKSYKGVGSSCSFDGIYNANGHSIMVNIESGDGCIFPYLEGTVANLIAIGRVDNSSHAAGIARSVRSTGAVINCISFVTVSGGSNSGGITASNQAGGTIINCYFGGTLLTDVETAPICVWINGRNGTFKNNYYIESAVDNSGAEWIEHEDYPLSGEEVKTVLADKMNGYINDPKSELYAYASMLCEWSTEGGLPTLIPKN